MPYEDIAAQIISFLRHILDRSDVLFATLCTTGFLGYILLKPSSVLAYVFFGVAVFCGSRLIIILIVYLTKHYKKNSLQKQKNKEIKAILNEAFEIKFSPDFSDGSNLSLHTSIGGLWYVISSVLFNNGKFCNERELLAKKIFDMLITHELIDKKTIKKIQPDSYSDYRYIPNEKNIEVLRAKLSSAGLIFLIDDLTYFNNAGLIWQLTSEGERRYTQIYSMSPSELPYKFSIVAKRNKN